MPRSFTMLLASTSLLLSACPEDQCYKNDDCIGGYACTKEGKCVEVDPLLIDNKSVPDALVGELYQEIFQASGGIQPYTWSIETDETWLSMQATSGILSGTPESAATGATFKVFVTDSSIDNTFDTESYIINITNCDPSHANPCNGNGDCTGATGDCTCHQGYSGNQCETCSPGYHDEQGQCLINEECLTQNPCSGHGQCDDSTGQAICTCEPEYDGDECELCAGGFHDVAGTCIENEECAPDTCSGNGDCDDTSGEAVCDCYDDWDGESCDVCVWFPCMDQVKLVSPNPLEGGTFGGSVAVHGDFVVVGVPGADHDTGKGAVYVYRRDENGELDGGVKLVSPDLDPQSPFGAPVSMSGDYLVVGAPGDDSQAEDAGAVFVFHRIGVNTWDPGVKIVSPDPEAGDFFGATISMDGDDFAVGMWAEDRIGEVHVFRRTGQNSWMHDSKIVDPEAEVLSGFGTTVSLSGEYLMVGAPADSSVFPRNGAAYIFHNIGSTGWDTGTKIMAHDASEGDVFGYSVAIKDEYAVVTAPFEDSGGTDSGAMYIFHRESENDWGIGSKVVAPDADSEDKFGFSKVSISEYVVVGTPYKDIGGQAAGSAYVFRRTGINSWDSGTKIVAFDGERGDLFGGSVSIDGNRLIVSAWGDDSVAEDAGAAYVY